jgi:hypothetical protein
MLMLTHDIGKKLLGLGRLLVLRPLGNDHGLVNVLNHVVYSLPEKVGGVLRGRTLHLIFSLFGLAVVVRHGFLSLWECYPMLCLGSCEYGQLQCMYF